MNFAVVAQAFGRISPQNDLMDNGVALETLSPRFLTIFTDLSLRLCVVSYLSFLMSHYCESAPGHPFHGPYHNGEYGFPVSDDNVLFERLVLEINQAGLSWLTILKKRDGFRDAYHQFDIATVASYGESDRHRLLSDARIIRNRLKVDAAIANAQQILKIQQSSGSFADWLDNHHPKSKADWVKLFKQHFRFVGGEIVGEFLMSMGYLPGAHLESCPVYEAVAALNPPWMQCEPRF
ncbi:MAG: DNA-3-methyladenine glycosylase I [Elainellaceae cyanobacterium]